MEKCSPPNDADFRKTIASFETFKRELPAYSALLALETIQHRADPCNILEHTHDVLMRLRSDDFDTIRLAGIRVALPELVRMVALYHDLDKYVRQTEPTFNAQQAKEQSISIAIQELNRRSPPFFFCDNDKNIFALLMKHGDYFGYNLDVLAKTGTAFRQAVKTLLETHVEKPIEEFAKETGVFLEAEDLLKIQFELSRADTLGIESFKNNVGQIDRLYAEMQKGFAY